MPTKLPQPHGPIDGKGKPLIVKHGTITCDLVETNPVIWKDRLLRFESVRDNQRGNESGRHCFRFVDWHSGEATPTFGEDYKFGCAFVAGDRMIVTGSSPGCLSIDIFESADLVTWSRRPCLTEPRYQYYNTSICHDGSRYVLLFEINRPWEECGPPFTARFAFSDDLRSWTISDPACVYSRDRYTAPHCLRYHDGYYYLFYLEQYDGFGTRVARSTDLREWRSSWFDPVLKADDADRRIASEELLPEERRRIAEADNWNNSDIDMIEWQGKLMITYSWGSQLGIEHLATAHYDGPLSAFLLDWFRD